jgi:hypothetical protein
MAKLKARGRQEIARLLKVTPTPDDKDVSEEKSQIALMTDGNVLSRRVIRWRPGGSMTQYGGNPTHDYGWKVKGKIKAGLTAEDFVRIYQGRGFTLESSSGAYLVREGDTITDRSSEPIRSEAKAASQKKAATRRATQPKTPKTSKPGKRIFIGYKTEIDGEGKGEGAGLYVTNATSGLDGTLNSNLRSAVYGPFASMELAEIAAWDRLSYIEDMRFTHLSPVEIVEGNSKDHVEAGFGHSWWRNGVHRGPPIDRRQLRLFDRSYSP